MFVSIIIICLRTSKGFAKNLKNQTASIELEDCVATTRSRHVFDKKHRSFSSFDDLRQLNRCADKECVIGEVLARPQCFMGCELRVAKTGRVGALLRTMETGPLGIWGEVLTDVSLLGRVLRLIDQR